MIAKLIRWVALFATIVLGTLVHADEPKPIQPEVEVVFCLDTTGSMGGLIAAAKSKIWSVSNQIAAGRPTPRLKVGLVAFRDRGDAYVTKVFDLTDDLDTVYTNLMAFQAQGGGDTPESVNQALNESVTKISWSKNTKTLKIIFLVGDAPPHMDYKDDVKYPESCQLAVKNNIIINTIQCGSDNQTRKYWQDICRHGEGSYVQIEQTGGQIAHIVTPFDADLAKLNSELNSTVLIYGRAERQSELRASTKAASAPLPTAVAADRAAYNSIANGGGTSYDLLRNIQLGTVKLENLKKEELPAELQKLTLEEQRDHLKKLESRRKDLTEKAQDLNRKRNEYTTKKQTETDQTRPRDGFDSQVLSILQQQARQQNIEYATPEEKKR